MGLWHKHRHRHWWRHHGHRHDDHRHHGRYKWWKRYGYHYPTKCTTGNTVSKFVEEEREIKDSISTSSETYERDITYVRSRNVEFDTTSLKPFTFFTPFFSSVKVDDNVVPKLLEIRVISGNFIPGETIESSDTFVGEKFIARLCVANHKEGPYVNPSKTYSLNPYTRQSIQEQYSESSTILNIDTKSLELPSETEFYGSVKVGMTLNGKSSGASAVVTDIRLISDVNGRLIGSFFIPDPNTSGNPKFNNGTNTFSLLDVDDLSLSNQARSIAEAEYYTVGTENITESIITTTRDIKVTPAHTKTITTVKNTGFNVPSYRGIGWRSLRSILSDMDLILGDLIEAETQEAKALENYQVFKTANLDINLLRRRDREDFYDDIEGDVIGKFDTSKFKYRYWIQGRNLEKGWDNIKFIDENSFGENQKLEKRYLQIFEDLGKILARNNRRERASERLFESLSGIEQDLDFVNTSIFKRLKKPNEIDIVDGQSISTFTESRLADLNELKSRVNKAVLLLPTIGITLNADGSIVTNSSTTTVNDN